MQQPSKVKDIQSFPLFLRHPESGKLLGISLFPPVNGLGWELILLVGRGIPESGGAPSADGTGTNALSRECGGIRCSDTIDDTVHCKKWGRFGLMCHGEDRRDPCTRQTPPQSVRSAPRGYTRALT